MHPGTSGSRRLPKGLIKRIWREFLRPYRRMLLLLFLSMVGTSALLVAPAPITGAVIDTIAHGGEDARGRLNLLLLAFLVVKLAWAGMTIVQRWAQAWLGQHLILDLRCALFDHVQRMPLAFFTRTQTGAL